MKQHYFLTDSIDSVASISTDLHAIDIDDDHIHVVGRNPEAIEARNISCAREIDETDIVCWSERGAILGAAMGILFVWITATWQPFGVTFSVTTMLMVAVLMVAVTAFWGGVFGNYVDNYRIARFRNEIRQGQFLMMIDTEASQEGPLKKMMRQRHPEATWMGKDSTIANPFHG